MMRIAILALALAGCFDTAPASGVLQCNYRGGRVCPVGFTCAEDRRCWRVGELPDLSGTDLFASDDLEVGDLAGVDLAVADADVPDLWQCEGLSCQIARCDLGRTTISGRVRGPSGVAPVYNALVFVPAVSPAPFTDGPSCMPCESLVSGSPIAMARTSFDGSFVLENAPDGSDIPLVVQVGKWRRQTRLQTVNACADNVVPEDQTRLPRNKTEGDIPLHAVTTGDADSIECVPRIMGVADSEYTAPSGDGRIHLYQDNGARMPSVSPSPAATLLNSLPRLQKYDVVIFGCNGTPATPTATPLQNVANYVAGGGRLVIAHHNYTWLTMNPSLVAIASWTSDPTPTNPTDPVLATIPTTTPLKQAFAQWLIAAGSSDALGTMTIRQARPLAIEAPSTTVDWLRTSLPATVQLLSARVPVGVAPEQQCGRAVFVDFHTPTTSDPDFPQECTQPGLIQHRALEFIFYDLYSCP